MGDNAKQPMQVLLDEKFCSYILDTFKPGKESVAPRNFIFEKMGEKLYTISHSADVKGSSEVQLPRENVKVSLGVRTMHAKYRLTHATIQSPRIKEPESISFGEGKKSILGEVLTMSLHAHSAALAEYFREKNDIPAYAGYTFLWEDDITLQVKAFLNDAHNQLLSLYTNCLRCRTAARYEHEDVCFACIGKGRMLPYEAWDKYYEEIRILGQRCADSTAYTLPVQIVFDHPCNGFVATCTLTQVSTSK